MENFAHCTQMFLNTPITCLFAMLKSIVYNMQPHVPTSNNSFGSASRLLYFSNSKNAKLTFRPSEKTCESFALSIV